MRSKVFIHHGDNFNRLSEIDSNYFNLIYIDPPFNTGITQKRGNLSYQDDFFDYMEFLKPRLE